MKKQINLKTYFIYFGILLLSVSCQRDSDDDFKGIDQPDETIRVDDLSALPTAFNFPNNNTFSNDKFELGQALFWDPILSGNRDVACATCHHPDFGYADGREISLGVNGVGIGPNRQGGNLIERNAPTILNTAFNGIDVDRNYNPNSAPMFWDNRANSLEEQALLPILNHDEMKGDVIAEGDIINVITQRINAIPAYQNMFAAAFGNTTVNGNRIAQALATFQRTLVANNSRFDQYMRGDMDALSNQEIQGMNTFIDAGCVNCHSGPMLSDYELHTLSVPDHPLVSDDGANGNFNFRTPTLRNLNRTAPYMHNGSFDNLRQVLNFYRDISRGNGDSQNPNVDNNQIDQDARNLRLNNNDINEIISFLNTLDDDDFDKTIPQNVPSGLTVGGNIN